MSSTYVSLLQVPAALAGELGQRLEPLGFEVTKHNDPIEFADYFDSRRIGCVIAYNWSDGSESLALVQRLCDRPAPARLLLLVKECNAHVAFRAARLGVSDVRHGETPIDQLVTVISELAAFDRVQRPKDLRDLERLRQANRLNESERAVLRCMLRGLSTKETAHDLDMNPRTVENRRLKVFDAFGTRSIAVLSRSAQRLAAQSDYLRIDDA